MATLINGKSFAEVYKEILTTLLYTPEHRSSPRGQKTHEIQNLIVEIEDVTQNIFTNKVRSVPKKYLAGELMWYFSGRNDLEFISKYSKFWDSISDDGKCNSAYGNLIFTEKNEYGYNEWSWARKALIDDAATRQAIIRFNKPQHSYFDNKDFVCTLTGIFAIRNNKLDFTVTMRSNDVFFGMTYDYPFFLLLQQQMRLHLLKYYPDLELGKFTHMIMSAHMYERNFETVKKMLNEEFVSELLPLIDTNLVCPDGSPTSEMDELVWAIDKPDRKRATRSDIYDWIYKYGVVQ